MKRRVTRYNDRFGPSMSSGMTVLAIFLAAVVILSVYFACNAFPLRGSGDTAAEDLPEVAPPPPETEEMSLIPEELTARVNFSNADIAHGYLILVNKDHEYSVGGEDVVALYHNEDKSPSYGLATSDIACERSILPFLNEFLDAYSEASGDENVVINSGYRSFEAQQQILDDRIASDGEEEAYKYVALPGQSEHHTGLGMDIASWGENYNSAWLTENCWHFGFVQRYRADKVAITGISSEYWHYRYVGKPHAEIMVKENLCLEEYIELIRTYTYEKPYTFAAEDGTQYVIYSVRAVGSEEAETAVPVPKGAAYTVSGDNIDGFIVSAVWETSAAATETEGEETE